MLDFAGTAFETICTPFARSAFLQLIFIRFSFHLNYFYSPLSVSIFHLTLKSSQKLLIESYPISSLYNRDILSYRQPSYRGVPSPLLYIFRKSPVHSKHISNSFFQCIFSFSYTIFPTLHSRRHSVPSC